MKARGLVNVIDMPRKKTFSARLIEMEEALGISPETLAFILGIKYEMFRRYHSGEFDHTYSIRKDRFGAQLENMDIEIEDKINLLKRALRNFHKNYGTKYGKNGNANGALTVKKHRNKSKLP